MNTKIRNSRKMNKFEYNRESWNEKRGVKKEDSTY